MDATQSLYTLPKDVGERRTHPASYVVFAIALVVASTVASQIVAYRLGFNSRLGLPIAHSSVPFARSLYAPWAWFGWVWLFLNPFSGYNPLTHQAYWPSSVYAALRTLPLSLGLGFLASVGSMIATTVVCSGRGDRVDELVDSARWARRADVEREGFLGAQAGPIIGGFATRHGIVPLRYDGELGISYVGPPGDGKSALEKTSLLISLRHAAADSWTPGQRLAHPYGEEPSALVLDPKGNLFASTSRYQADVLGKEVFQLEPLAEATHGRARYNPLWSIHIGTDREMDDCYQTSLDIVDREGEGLKTYWDKASTAFGAAMIAKCGYRALYRNDPTLLSLPALVDYITSMGSIHELVTDMLETPDDPHGVFAWTKLDGKPTAVRPWIANAARGMGAKAEEEKSGVYGSFLEQLSIYRSEVLRKHINESTVSFQELANRPRPGMVYLNVPAMRLDHLRPYIRMVTRAALRELTESTNNIDGREVRGNLRSTLIVLDEVASLKHVEELATASGFLRGHGVILMMFWQSYSQLTRLYGENESISETVDVHIFGRPKTFKAAKLISDALGSFSTVVTKRNKSGHRLRPGPLGHLTEQADISTRPLLTPSEVMRIPQGNNIIISRGLKINANKFRYFENAQLDARARLGAVARSDVMHTKPLFFQRLEEQLGREQFARLLVPTPETPQKPRRTLAKRTKRVRVAVAAEGSLIAQYAAAIEAVPNA